MSAANASGVREVEGGEDEGEDIGANVNGDRGKSREEVGRRGCEGVWGGGRMVYGLKQFCYE